MLLPDQLAAVAVRDAVRAILARNSRARTAARLAAPEIAERPAAAVVGDQLEHLVADRRSTASGQW